MAARGSYGFGIIGCGMIAEFHAEAIRAMKSCRLVAVNDCVEKNVKRMTAKYGCDGYTDLKEMLARPDIDIVTIATPSGAHLEPTLAAARAGKHIICEKPLEVTLERIDRMTAACEKNDVMLAGIFPRRFNPSTMELRKAVLKGRFGKLTEASAYIKWWRTQEYYDSGAWRGTWKLDGGGCLMNQGIHTIDLMYYLAGDVVEVAAFADRLAHKQIEVEDAAVAALRFKNGALGVIQGSTSDYPGHAAEVHVCGTGGSVFMKDDKFTVWEFRKKSSSDKRIMEKYGDSGGEGAGAGDPRAISFIGHQRNFEDAVKALKKGGKPLVDGVEGRKSIEIIMAVYKSALSGGKPVKLPLKKTPLRRSFR